MPGYYNNGELDAHIPGSSINSSDRSSSSEEEAPQVQNVYNIENNFMVF